MTVPHVDVPQGPELTDREAIEVLSAAVFS
jgi:hypothetical protein